MQPELVIYNSEGVLLEINSSDMEELRTNQKSAAQIHQVSVINFILFEKK